jgi:hypothetical protein
MSLWQFQAAVGGFAKANRIDEAGSINSEEAARLANWLDEPASWA